MAASVSRRALFEFSVAKPALDIRTVFDENFDCVWHTVRRLGVRPPYLEDAVQEVFLKFYKRSADYDATRPVRPWLIAFARRVAADYRRLGARRAIEVDLGVWDGPAAELSADERIEARERWAVVEQALKSLHGDRRPVFILHVIHEVPVREIAERLAIPLNTAYSRLRLARNEFGAAAKRIGRALRGASRRQVEVEGQYVNA
jgi:RNA polymerase sigma-70 factor (ECF subfamily)